VEGRSEVPERLDEARPSRRKVLTGALGVLGVAGAGALTATSVADAAESIAGMGLRPAERLASMGPTSGGAPLPLGVGRVIWSVEVDEPVFGLTFDDGPDPEFTPRVLEILRERKLRATFNMMGWNAVHHASLAAEVVAAGHEVGNHSWSHLNLAFADEATTHDEILRGSEAIVASTGVRPHFFRPPRGVLTGYGMRVATTTGHDVLMYTLTGSVPGSGSPAGVRRHVVEGIRPGYIVDFHDGIGRGTFDRNGSNGRHLTSRRNAEIEALPRILDDLQERGYRSLAAGDLVARAGF
jgi:peptidoglycan/xylan/chitin deacetylase (PgdA/CDA1 family)